MTSVENPKCGISNPPEPLPLSLINDFLYCPRRAALKVVEGCREENVHTTRGDIVHEHTHLEGYEVSKGAKLLRALPVWSERLGINGKCDVVEQRPDGVLYPVEFKVGKRRQWDNDDAQLCAQALCLEEMFQTTVARGAIFHADSKRRREVQFTPALRARTERAIVELRALAEQFQMSDLKSEIQRLPAAVFRPACEHCSLFEVCLPQVTSAPAALERAARELFQI
ncbi:MAG: CRISPR-associated protein Cas4 [Verrucomicrobiae bacterium]|nr:CRISPR-associated protein Cas4 [Verrucomicrobiae bacterium]